LSLGSVREAFGASWWVAMDRRPRNVTRCQPDRAESDEWGRSDPFRHSEGLPRVGE